MAIIPLKIPEGIYKNGTDNQRAGRWSDCNLIRFYEDTIRPVLGWRFWALLDNNTDQRCPRGIHAWRDNSGSRWLSTGQYDKVYVFTISGVKYDITPTGMTTGRLSAEENLGYGGGTYSTGEYGTQRVSTGNFLPATVYHYDNYGEHLLFMHTDSGILYRWELNTSLVATQVTNAPTGLKAIVVSENRFVMACQSRTVNWSSQEQITDWTPTTTNSAGSFTLNTSGTIQSATRVRKQVFFITDEDCWVANYLGSPFYWGFEKVGTSGIIAPRGFANIDMGCVFMGQRGFYLYNGNLQKLNCEIADFLFDDINRSEIGQIYAVPNRQFSEVIWFYPSSTNTHCDKYVSWNYEKNVWSIGKCDRSCGVDRGVFELPIYASSLAKTDNNTGTPIPAQNMLLEHEVGVSYPEAEGSTAGVPFLESGDIDLQNDKVLHLTKLIPDESNLGDVNIKLKSKYFPTSSEEIHPSTGHFSSTNPTPIRVSGKQLKVRFEANPTQPSDFRIGTFKVEGKVGGGR